MNTAPAAEEPLPVGQAGPAGRAGRVEIVAGLAAGVLSAGVAAGLACAFVWVVVDAVRSASRDGWSEAAVVPLAVVGGVVVTFGSVFAYLAARLLRSALAGRPRWLAPSTDSSGPGHVSGPSSSW